jgi:cobyrinic acid a,c-diamide synthase
MKSIVISSNCSGGGKTTVTLGIMKALMNRGYKVQGYKTGPDYIDSAFHTTITGSSSRNLDLFLMGEEGVKAAFSRGSGDFGVVEGVMGLYDGKGIDTKYSTAHLAKTLGLPVILVITPKAQSVTLCAEINGLIDFGNVNISGIILNNISESYYKLLRAAIEKNCRVKVLGYVPSDERLKLKSRHLGLVQSNEIEDIKEKINVCSELIEKNVDMDYLMKCFKATDDYNDSFHAENKGIRTAVAFDSAFSFYYKENLELLNELGEVIYFSPLKDKELPENIDFLYIGGGYPEVFSKELSSNISMRKSIRTALENGLHCYAECGGLMYLTESIEEDEMVGFFKGITRMTSRLQNFGYAEVKINKKNPILPEGIKINCHEFHTSYVELSENKIYEVTKETFDGTIKKWECGYVKNNTLAGYAHVHFIGNLELLRELITVKCLNE